MLQLAVMTDQGPIGIIGINDENLLRMKAGMPLKIDIKKITPPGTRINEMYIHFGHTYEDVVKDMEEADMPIDPLLYKAAKEMDDRVKRERLEKSRKKTRG